jgi:hypothetical protein
MQQAPVPRRRSTPSNPGRDWLQAINDNLTAQKIVHFQVSRHHVSHSSNGLEVVFFCPLAVIRTYGSFRQKASTRFPVSVHSEKDGLINS